MSIKAIFIGINKHEDPAIPELNGATRDVTALWALFSDTIETLSAWLILDKNATYRTVQAAIFDSLSSATSDDVIILTFAGHGSPDGNLVMYDTEGTNLANTAISMATLADAFKETKARAVLFVLDCCFSGQAPARVFEVEAVPRNPFTFSTISGEGRILLAACAPNEVAWEQPGTGHGLLTHAVIQALQGEPGMQIQFPDIAGEIVRLTRAEGLRIGVTQTPVFLGNVQGGLMFPALQRGANFNVAFPMVVPQKIDSQFEELSAFGVAPQIISQWSIKFPDGLNKLQLQAINEYGILQGNSLLVIAPASSGKTMIGELAAIQSVQQGKKAAFLLPYRALVHEKYHQFSDLYGKSGIRVIRCSGDASDGIATALAGRYDIGFFTYETFLNMSLNSQRLLHQLGVIIIDEAQFITDPTRGITVELILYLLLRAKENGINPQLLLLSAVIGNLNGFDRWLNVAVLLSKERPVPLIEGVLDRQGVFQFVDVDGSIRQESLLLPSQIIQRRDKESSQDVIVPLAKKLVSESEKLIVFRNMRGSAQGCAKYLAKELGLPPAKDVLDALPEQDLTSASEDLRESLRGGTAFHNTNLLRAEREVIEKSFRNSNSSIAVLADTTTLAAGINTPASTVVLAENEFTGEDGRPFTIAEYKNMAGRAGRLGYKETGKSIILADTPLERVHLFQKYVLGSPEEIKSSFQPNDLPTWILRLLSHVREISAEDVPGLLVNTFGGYTASINNSQWYHDTQMQIERLIHRMIDTGLAVLERRILHLTLLGRACATSSLKFESALRLVELMARINVSSDPPISIVANIQVLPEADAIYTPVMKKGRSESRRLSDVDSRYGQNVMLSMQRYASEEICVWQRCKRAAILWDWLNGMSVEDIERQYSTTPVQGATSYGDIIRIVDASRFHLRSAHQILTALFLQNAQFLSQLDEILIRLEFGLPTEAIRLTQLPVQLTRGQHLSLFNAGYLTAEEVLSLTKEKLQELIGEQSAEELYIKQSLVVE